VRRFASWGGAKQKGRTATSPVLIAANYTLCSTERSRGLGPTHHRVGPDMHWDEKALVQH
jgi:hypothetical protein